jgi:hypothetical protein
MKDKDGLACIGLHWLRRWEVDGPNTGWAILVKPEF